MLGVRAAKDIICNDFGKLGRNEGAEGFMVMKLTVKSNSRFLTGRLLIASPP